MKSIATKLAVRVYAMIAAAFMLMLAAYFFSLDREVKEKGEIYAKAFVGIYGDLLVYESHNLQRPIDLSFSDRCIFFGEYMCRWYRMDYFYAYIPDFEKGTITYLSVIRNRKKFGDLADEHMEGETVAHVMTEEELDAWNDNTVYAITKSDRFEKATDLQMVFCDEFGNKVMVGAAAWYSNVMQDFLLSALFLFLILAALSVLFYLVISSKVTEPARRISRAMTDYISGGERSAVRLEAGDGDEFSMIAGAFNDMTKDIDRYIDDIARLDREQERQKTEVDIAAGIQMNMLPSGNARLENCTVKAVMKPARYIGGDLYDYIALDKSRTMAVVADVSGKGLPSALLMAETLTLIRQFARMGRTPAQILAQVNGTLSGENRRMMFVTAFVALYDSEAGTLTYANAGHNPAYLLSGTPRILDASHGVPLGLFPEDGYEDVCVRMDSGDTVFLYTDGVNEAVNGKNEFYGTERLEELLAGKEENCVDAVYESVRGFSGGAEQNDDITMLALRAERNPDLELDYEVGEFPKIKELLFSSGLPKALLMDLCVAAEECFVNICSYAFDGPAPEGEKILFHLEYSDKALMRFSDGGRRFDPRNDLPDQEDYDIDTAVGGLGRLIAFTIADSVDYEYSEGRNVLTITKSIN